MASLTLNMLQEPRIQIFLLGATLFLFIAVIFITITTTFTSKSSEQEETPSALKSFLKFFYASFLKPHNGDGTENGQQDALESFYKAQASVYDATRKRLLRGREDMLALVAAQLVNKKNREHRHETRRIWVDIGGGTGWNIEAMSKYVSVPEFFSSIYLVDFSPSLCEVARKRFQRLGWKNVKVVCQDARTFRLEDHEDLDIGSVGFSQSPTSNYFSDANGVSGADLITLSYSLSMIPDFYSVIDSLAKLLAPTGTIGVVDFYVQSIVDLSCRNYTGGMINRHVNWLGRLFWRAWFDVDRVNLEAGRRDYLEYRFGTVLSADSRNYLLGSIPYYMWLGCQKKPASSLAAPNYPHEIVERLDAAATESPQVFTDNSRGLYDTGGSRHAIRIIRLLSQTLGFSREIKALLHSKTLNEQREIWKSKIRPVIMSRLFAYLVVSQEKFLWNALGVPKNQLHMLEADYIASESAARNASPLEYSETDLKRSKGRAVWEYMVQTLDPVIESSVIGEENPYYLVCLQGFYTRKCHPDYLRAGAHRSLSRPGAFDGLRIHTDEIEEVLRRMAPGTLTIAVVMDSMDWFDPGAEAAEMQIRKLSKALKMGGRVLLRSAALTPWYIATFERLGFRGKRVGARIGGACIDRVNMYASCYLLTKVEDLELLSPASSPAGISGRQGSMDLEKLEI
ncbi:hypothetical protein SS1G_06142 [Sclerotinia sclerotiorum 1980 UF-70]|uniref:Methyltransferase domain-containing protein n=1 Tax=Sclerotinia sclerotiorum (strain ATCC 18683 / 1980 / Ss-1) TaxID=665079 RepID=A7ELE5_SCLS1|nr:hypothetical protein SS1G_06142 [Sclerotinia sclerotiorum 1980 UF-70]EDO03661.1 hypothetical protein SS1G_06142 [Sclerotinia sclerotiorum 1980 UF-70]